jgi:opacity protein-like surface antigen
MTARDMRVDAVFDRKLAPETPTRTTMKTRTFACLAGFALATAAQARTPATAMAPAPESGLWQWFIGGSVGYLTDLDETMYGLQVGMEYQSPGSRTSHAIYLEVGYTDDDASDGESPNLPGAVSWDASVDLDIIPITLNYKYQTSLTDRLDAYAGIGVGVAILDSSFDWSWSQAVAPPNNSGSGSDDESDVVFYGNIFAGLSYDISDSFMIYTGVRYIFMDNADLDARIAGVSSSYEAGIDGDVLVELGLCYRF